MVEGNRPFLPPEKPRGRRDRLALVVLDRNRRWFRYILPLGDAAGQSNYLDYFFPGALIMIVLFTSIFTMMSVIEDRKEGFLLSVLVAPVPRSAIVLGKVLGGTTLSAIQGLIFLAFAPLVGVHITFVGFLLIVLTIFLISFCAHRAGFRHCLAHGFFSGLPRHHQSVSHSAVVVVRGPIPCFQGFGLAANYHEGESAHLWG